MSRAAALRIDDPCGAAPEAMRRAHGRLRVAAGSFKQASTRSELAEPGHWLAEHAVWDQRRAADPTTLTKVAPDQKSDCDKLNAILPRSRNETCQHAAKTYDATLHRPRQQPCLLAMPIESAIRFCRSPIPPAVSRHLNRDQRFSLAVGLFDRGSFTFGRGAPVARVNSQPTCG